MKNTFLILFTLVVPGISLATEQQPDILVYDGQELYLSTGWGHPSPLETYYYQNNIETPFEWFSTANYRGHIAVWEVADDKLYLKEIQIEQWDPNNLWERSVVSYKPNEYGVESDICAPAENSAVFANWFSGFLDCYIRNSDGVYNWNFFHVRYGEIIDVGEHLGRLGGNYITYYFRLNEDDEIEFEEQDCRLITGYDRLSPVFGFYDNNHLNWPYNWENMDKSGAPHCKWLIEDSKLYLTGMELYSGTSFYEIDTEILDLTTLFDDIVVDGVVDANWVSGVYLIKHGYETKESAGWPGYYFTVFNVTEYTYIRLEEGKLLESYTVPKDFDFENLPENTDPELKQIIEDYKLPTIDDLTFKIAHDPSPTHNTILRNTWTNLSWTSGDTAVSNDVYFGDDFADVVGGTGGTFLGNQMLMDLDVGLPGSSFPDGLVPGTTYYWRIDGVEADGTKCKGYVWSFTIAPRSAFDPYPPDESTNVYMDVTLSWTAGIGGVARDVYFGEDFNDVNDGLGDTFKGNQNSTTFDLGALFPEGLVWGKTYYWRIDEVEADGSTINKGEVWKFTIIATPPKGRTCFIAETDVWVNGALVSISNVGPRQCVGRIDNAPTKNSLLPLPYLGKVEQLQEHEGVFECYDILLKSGNNISVADNHYFLTESGNWTAVQNLKTKMKLQTPNGSIEIVSVTKRPMPYVGKVYNLKVEGSDQYLVGKDAVIVRDY